jgi:PRC-barrel domain
MKSPKSRSTAPLAAFCLVFCLAVGPLAAAPKVAANGHYLLAQAMVPPTGMMDANKPTPMEERYLARYPQPARVGFLVGLPVLDMDASTIGRVTRVVRTRTGKIELIVSYSRWWGWFGRPVAVPLEVIGIAGRQLVSLDMPPREYAKAPTWQGAGAGAMILPDDATVRVALARN